ncbi:MAG TPA: glycosyltransferase family 4 protein [Ignavibacteria bacterium]|nr:glycosyltransferase family 4 protein [Ignavibacteria bacterium]
MNILFLTNELNYTDGVSTHLFYLSRYFKKNKNVELSIMCSGGDAVSKFKQAGINVHTEKALNHKTRSIKNFMSAILSVYKFVRSEDIQIVHSHNHYAANISYRVSKFIGFKTIQTNHGIIDDGGKLRHYSSGNYIVLNETILKYFLDNNISVRNNTKLISNGIDFPHDIVRKKSGIIRVIVASRLTEGKGLTTFIDAVSILGEEIRKKTEFILAGEGDMENKLRMLDRNLKTEIIFIGKQTNMNDILKDTNIFVFPSESDSEAFPMTLLEAAAANNLIIFSDFKGSNDILKDKVDGLMFRKGDANDLALKIKCAVENPDISNKISESFFVKAGKKYNSELMAEKHLRFYREILSERGK